MAANEDEVRLRLTAETLGYRKAWADVRVQTARDLASIKSTVTTSLNQTRVNAAQSLAGIRQSAATNFAQTRVNTAQQLAQIRVQTAQQLNQIRNNAAQTLGQMGSQFESTGRRMTVGLTLPLVALAAASIKSAKGIDTQLNVLRAFAGGSEAAEKRLAQLNATALKTPGLTNNLAVSLDAQLRPLKVAEQTIDRILPALGRLNAVSPLGDPEKFARNLTQLVTQNFERTDLKELVGQSPVAGQIITELFDVDSPINATAIRKAAQRMGIRTVDDFFAAFADAAARNKGLQNVTESIATRFEKLSDRVSLALRPLGLAIIDAFGPILDVAVPVIETLGRAFNALPGPIKTVTVGIGAFAAVIGPTIFIAGSLINTVLSLQKAYVALNALALIPTISNLRLLGQVIQGTAGLTAGAAATTAVRVGGLVAAIVAAAAVSVALARGTDGYLESLKKTHPWLARFGQSVLGALNPLYAMLKGLGLIGPETDKVADAQKQAVPAVKDFSDAVAEEAESLQQLRRALAEVELATKSRLAAAQRAYGEERTTLAQFTAERIRALEKERAAKLAQIDEDLRLKRQEAAARGGGAEGIGPHGGVDKEGKKLLDDIKQLELERKKVVQETTDSIADLQSEARNKERENEERHRDSLLSVMRTGAERQIEVLRDAAEQNESLRLDSERKIVEIERRQTDAEIAEVRRRIEAAAAGTEARTQLEDELAQKLAERGRQRAEQARRIAKAELDAALLPLRREGLKEGSRGAGDEGAIARIRDAAERRAISVAASEQQVANVIDAGFARRIKALKDEIAVREKHKQDVTALNAQLIELEQERTNASEEGERRVRDGREKDLENAREHADRLIPIERALASARLAVREAVLNATRATFGREAALRKERYAVARERARIEHDEAVADLNEREHAELLHTRKTLAKDEDFNKRRLEIQKLYDALRKAEDAKTAADIEGIDRDERRERDPFTRLKDLWTDFKDHVRNASDSIRESVAQMADTIRDAFGTLEGGIRQGIVAWLLYGESLGKALKRALAESLAAVAADAAIQALKHGAYAIGSLAFGDARGAILHAKAAAAFALLAVGAGAGARIAANSAGLTRNSSSSTAASAVGQDDGPRNKEFTYGVGSTPASADAGRGVQGHGLVGSALAPVLNRIDAHIEEQRKVNAMQQAFTARVTSHIESLGVTSEAQIVTIGAPDAHEAVGVAMVKESGRNAELNDTLARNFRVF